MKLIKEVIGILFVDLPLRFLMSVTVSDEPKQRIFKYVSNVIAKEENRLPRKKREVDPWEKWMGQLKYPVHPEELLDKGLARVIKVMNIPGKIDTFGSCLHGGLVIFFVVEDEKWFLNFMMPQILRMNDGQYGFNVQKLYDAWSPIVNPYRQIDKCGNQYYWMIKDNWRTPGKFVKDLEKVFWGLK